MAHNSLVAPPVAMSLGKHWIIECYECDRDVIDDPALIEPIMLEAANNAGATVMGSQFHTFEPQGVSGVVIIAESHLTIHTWPEYRYAAVDAFTCGETIDIDRAMDVLRDRFGTEEVILAGDLNRGIMGKNGLERAQAISIRQVDAVQSWRRKYELEDAWGILTSVDVHDCEPHLIRDEETVKRYAVELCEKIEMKRFGETVVVDFGEDERVSGFSLVQLIETSLVSGHFANQSNNAHIDVFSCKFYEPNDVANFTREFFGGRNYTLNVTLRK
ncbi:MAG: adenosylmethionine decarboxylase [Candidatus Omnitrophica bacterium]|nr:adenosylmethionine decarboxylase [Candidatus Omnitrophota bacterium]MCA9439755.1 adenosylmethionine decarboxylase [Candidatus Omnitrophota bacterium]